MRYRLMGRTGILLSEFGLGTNMFGGTDRWKAFGALDERQATEIVGAAIDSGVNMIDTADVYGDGESEVRVGQAIRNLSVSRHDVVIATKVALRTRPGPNAVGLSRAHVLASAESSLRRLKCDHIDLYQLHSFDPVTPFEETLAALDILVRQGKVRYVGCSNFAAWQIALARGAAMAHALPKIEAIEANYTIASRVIEREIVPLAEHQGIGILVWGPLAAGLLTGKYDRQGKGPENSRLGGGGHTMADRDTALAAVEAIRPIAEAHRTTVGAIALAWLLHRRSVTSVIVGCRTQEQLRENLASADIVLSASDLAALDAIGGLPIEYPMNKQDRLAADRLAPLRRQTA
jgi:aryl-alcohol dehydrogenase-like predicted oxidoreductase